jgi:cytochrome c-type biogenesis protein CcmF
MSTAGYLAIALALVSSLYAAAAHVIAGHNQRASLLKGARAAALASFVLTTAAVLVLLFGLLTHNFSLQYVADYTSRDTPAAYLVSALWAGNAGSLLFWAWLLSLFGVVVAFREKETNRELVPYATAVIMLNEAFFLILLLSVANPFHRLSPVPADGQGLNPLLQNPGMIIHPPALLAGYAAFTIPFAFAVAALLKNRVDDDWPATVWRWALLAWLLLGVGNIIGAWWAYVELGWGGYWAWDPVENAGLMPWLVGTAFLHSIVLQRRKGTFKTWSMALIILTFNLAIFGTFLTRSGFLSSVHTFGKTGLEPFFITFLAITVLVPAGLLFYRRETLGSADATENLVSRENAFLLNNILLLGSAAIVFFGTLFPAISQAINGAKVEVGKAFFNHVNGPIFIAIILLAGICTLIGGRRGSARDLTVKLLWPLVLAVITGGVVFVSGVRQGYILGAAVFGGFVGFAVISQWVRESAALQKVQNTSFAAAWWRSVTANRAHYGAYIVHLSIVLFALGVIGSSFYGTEKDAALNPGESVNVQGYRLVYNNVNLTGTQSKMVIKANVSVYSGDKLRYTLQPSKIYASSYDQPVTEVAIHSNPVQDIYVILSAWKDGVATFKVLINPMVMWLWIGGGVFLLGGLVAFWPARRRAPVEVETPAEVGQKKLEAADSPLPPEAPAKRFCAQCGSRRGPDDRFCTSCGAPLENGKDEI